MPTITVPIAGVAFQPDADAVLRRLELRTELKLEHEPINPFVAVLWMGLRLGYVPWTNNTPIALAIEAGRPVAAVFAGINGTGVPEVTITWDDIVEYSAPP